MKPGWTTVAIAAAAALALGWWLGGMRDAETAPSPARPARAPTELPPAEADGASRSAGPSRARRPEKTEPGAAAPAVSAAGVAIDDPARPTGRLRTGRVTLFALMKHRDYQKATFSFEHGVREDPEFRITGNDKELLYGSGTGDHLNVRTVADDTSTIADLGAFGSIEEAAHAEPSGAESAMPTSTAVKGHAYLVHSVDTHSDHYSLFHVVELLSADQMTFDWADWTPPPRPSRDALTLSVDARRGLASLLDGALVRETSARRQQFGAMKDPAAVVLQVRTSAQGGNRSSVTLEEPSRWERVRPRDAPLDVSQPPAIGDPATAFVRGGYVPEGMAYVIESADVYADVSAESSGDVSFAIKGDTLVALGEGEGPVLDWHEGRAVIFPGEERLVVVRAEDSGAVDVRLRGRFVPVAEAAKIEPVPFWAGPAPPGVARAGGGPADARSSYLAEPRAVLQVRAAHGGGNPMRVSLLGKASGYLDKLSNTPLPAGAPDPNESGSDSIGHVEGGRIPRGKAFVVTRVDYDGRTKENHAKDGHSSFLVSVMGTKIASIRGQDADDTATGTWTGRIVVPSGSEGQVFVETSSYTYGSAVLTGEFVDVAR